MRIWTEKPPLRRICDNLRSFSMLAGLSPRAIARIIRHGHWFCLPGGHELERNGDHDRALFFVLSGCLSVSVDDERGHAECIAYISRGETVGEMSLMSDEPHSAHLVAVRDTELLCLPKAVFEEIAQENPELLRNLSAVLVDRLRRTTHRQVRRMAGGSIAIIPLEDEFQAFELARALVREFKAMGLSAYCASAEDANQPADWFHHIENEHDLLLYIGDGPDTLWVRQMERRADRILVVRQPGALDVDHRRTRRSASRLYSHAPDLVTCGSGPDLPLNLPSWIYRLHHRVRPGTQADVARLARHLTGKAIGLVLSGGGARAFAHIGVVRAMMEAGIPIDAVGGTSMGAIVAASVAMGWGADEIEARIRSAFVETNPLSDYAVPTVAFFRGGKVARLLESHFGGRELENLALPYFCVSADLTNGTDSAHKSGSLVEALKASVAIPGILPPVAMCDSLHVDGGVMNNLPVDHMRTMCDGPIIAVDVSGDTALHPREGGRITQPNILAVLMRTSTVGNEFQRREARKRAALVIDPPVEHIGFRQWQTFEDAVSAGYATAKDVFALPHPALNGYMPLRETMQAAG